MQNSAVADAHNRCEERKLLSKAIYSEQRREKSALCYNKCVQEQAEMLIASHRQ